MTKKQQDLAWKCLTKEVRDKIKFDFGQEFQPIRNYLIDIFGYYNIISDTEPGEMLMVERKKVTNIFSSLLSEFEDIKSKPIPQHVGTERDYIVSKRCFINGCITELKLLFGDKCLSDKEESTDEVLNALEHYRNTATPDQKANDLRRLESECLSGKEGVDLNKLDKMLDEALEKETPESMKEWLDSQEEQPKPKFKVGDKVVIIQGKYKGVKGIIKIYSEDDNTWAVILDDIDYLINFTEQYLKHYTEETMEEDKTLNLLEILEQEQNVYNPSYGNGVVKFIYDGLNKYFTVQFENQGTNFHFWPNGILYYTHGRPSIWPNESLYEEYPLDAYSAWQEWKREESLRDGEQKLVQLIGV